MSEREEWERSRGEVRRLDGVNQVEWGEVVLLGRGRKEVELDLGDVERRGSLLPCPAREAGQRSRWESLTDVELMGRSDQERWKGERIELKQVFLSLLSKEEKNHRNTK